MGFLSVINAYEISKNVVEDVSKQIRAFVAEQQAYLQSGHIHIYSNL